MANSKISALTGATTPLAGTEVLPIVQSGATKQVSVADLTAGRVISASGGTFKTTGAYGTVSVDNTGTTGGGLFSVKQNSATSGIFGVTGAIRGDTSSDLGIFSETGKSIEIFVNGSATAIATFSTAGNLTLNNGNLTFGTSGKGVKGVSTNTNATAGNVGEYISSTVAYNAVTLTTGVQANVTSISLTAGDWDVSGSCLVDGPSTTVLNYMLAGFSSTSATLPVYQYRNALYFQGGATPFSTVNVYANPPTFRFSLSATTTIYMVVMAGFSVNFLTSGGYIAARRVQPGA
jgi:hypothetical protein